MTPQELQDYRRRLRMSQPELARALDVHPMTISKWERGVMPIEHGTMLRLALERLAELRKEEAATHGPASHR